MEESIELKKKRNIGYQSSVTIHQLHQQNEEIQKESKQKRRFIWPSSLHEDFLRAVFEVGLNQATVQSLGSNQLLNRVNPDTVDSHLRLLRQFVNLNHSGFESNSMLSTDQGLSTFCHSQLDSDNGAASNSRFSIEADNDVLLQQIQLMSASIYAQHQQIECAERSLCSQISLFSNILFNASRLDMYKFSQYHLPYEIFAKYVEYPANMKGAVDSNIRNNLTAANIDSAQCAALSTDNGQAGGNFQPGFDANRQTDKSIEDSPTSCLSNASLMLEMQPHIDLHKRLQKQRDDQLSMYGPSTGGLANNSDYNTNSYTASQWTSLGSTGQSQLTSSSSFLNSTNGQNGHSNRISSSAFSNWNGTCSQAQSPSSSSSSQKVTDGNSIAFNSFSRMADIPTEVSALEFGGDSDLFSFLLA